MGTVFVLASGANLSAMMTSVGRMNSTPCHIRHKRQISLNKPKYFAHQLRFKVVKADAMLVHSIHD